MQTTQNSSEFKKSVASNIEQLSRADDLHQMSLKWIEETAKYNYTYNFEWLGRPIIQFPQDILAFQEIIWSVKPDLIIETGIAHGGSLILSASMLALLDMSEAIQSGQTFDANVSKRKVVGVDIDIRKNNRLAIEAHPMASRIQMFQGSSIDQDIIKTVQDFSANYSRILVCLDSNHTHDHVLAELNAYAGLVSPESYCVVYDTVVEQLPKSSFPDRPWGPGNSPMTAVAEYLKSHPEFSVDLTMDSKLLVSVAPGGYLKRQSA